MSAPNCRPLSDDHVELLVPSRNLCAFDHEVLPLGPIRTPHVSRRSSPYSSPRATNRPAFGRTSSSSSWSSYSDIESDSDAGLSPNLATKSSPLCPIAFLESPHTRKRDCAYGSDARDGCDRQGSSVCKKSDLRVSKQTSSSIPIPVAAADEPDSDSDPNQIDKPPGEAGRPGRGGYTLRGSVNWSDKTYARVKVCELYIHSRFSSRRQKYIDNLVEEKLDCKVSFGNQSLRSLQDVRSCVSANFKTCSPSPADHNSRLLTNSPF